MYVCMNDKAVSFLKGNLEISLTGTTRDDKSLKWKFNTGIHNQRKPC